MDLLIILYFAYAVYRAGLDAAVNSYALSRGRDVYVGEGGNRRHYAGWTVGAALAVAARSLVEGWRAAWPWARERAAESKARRAARRDRPAPGPTPRRPDPAPADLDGDDSGGFRCARCGRDLDESASARPVPDEGWVCNAHLDDFCAACGHPPRADDPLVLDAGVWVHRSHTRDPRSGFFRGPADGGPADVVDADGRPVASVWEPPRPAPVLEPPRPADWPSAPAGRPRGAA